MKIKKYLTSIRLPDLKKFNWELAWDTLLILYWVYIAIDKLFIQKGDVPVKSLGLYALLIILLLVVSTMLKWSLKECTKLNRKILELTQEVIDDQTKFINSIIEDETNKQVKRLPKEFLN